MSKNPFDDPMMKMLRGPIEAAIQPLFEQAKSTLRSKIVGEMPPKFAEVLKRDYGASAELALKMWTAACEATAEATDE